MPTTYSLDSVVQTGRTKELAQFFKQKITDLDAESALRGVSYQNNTIKFFTTTDTTKTPAFSFDFPAEKYLDQTKTKIENNFSFNSATYAGATNPNLDGKPVLVFAVKSHEGLSDTINYSFLDLSAFISQDPYTASDTSIVIDSGTNKIRVAISAVPYNAITKKNDGLHVDISDKVDKVAGATAGHIATFVSGGNLSDTGIAFATAAEFTAMLNEVFPSGGGA